MSATICPTRAYTAEVRTFGGRLPDLWETRHRAMLRAMGCPFCGQEMRRGWIRLGGFGLYPSICSLLWVPEGRERGRRRLSFGRQRHGARGCDACGAVVLDPASE